MAAEFIDTLQEVINSICDRLYTDRGLITKQSVKKSVLLHESWLGDEEHLDQVIPQYINAWRLNNLNIDTDQATDTIVELKAQLCKYKADAYHAQQTINRLHAELVAKNNENKLLRANIVRDLRGLLDV